MYSNCTKSVENRQDAERTIRRIFTLPNGAPARNPYQVNSAIRAINGPAKRITGGELRQLVRSFSRRSAPVVRKPARKETPVRTSSTEAARHRESDDAGGDDDEDSDPARVRYLQRARVLSLLLAGEALTQPKALEYKIWRLAARCCELAKRGFNIQKRRLPGNFTEYTIDPNNPYTEDRQSSLPFEGGADR